MPCGIIHPSCCPFRFCPCRRFDFCYLFVSCSARLPAAEKQPSQLPAGFCCTDVLHSYKHDRIAHAKQSAGCGHHIAHCCRPRRTPARTPPHPKHRTLSPVTSRPHPSTSCPHPEDPHPTAPPAVFLSSHAHTPAATAGASDAALVYQQPLRCDRSRPAN